MHSLNSIGKIIRKMRKERNWTLEHLAGKIGKSKTYISLIENSARRLNTRLIEDFAKAFNVPAANLLLEGYALSVDKKSLKRADLAFNGGETSLMRELKAVVEKHTSAKSANTALINIRRIPVVSSTAAGDPIYFEDSFPIGYSDDFVECPSEVSDPNAFALRIKGDSMEDRFCNGDTIIVCPNWQVKENRPVVAKIGDGKITCKIYNRKDEMVVLSSVTPKYQPKVFHVSEMQWIYPVAKLISTVY